MSSQCSSPNPKPYRRLSCAVTKMRELVTPSAPPSLTRASSEPRMSQIEAKSTERPVPIPFSTVRHNSQTMKNYAMQRCNITPLREPASFPTSLNFSQQTIYLFDASDDDEDDNTANYYLEDILAKTHETKAIQLSPKSMDDADRNKKSRKFSFNAFPLHKSMSFQAPRKSVKRTASSFFRNINSNPSVNKPHTIGMADSQAMNKSSKSFTRMSEHESIAPEEFKFPERKRLNSLPTNFESVDFNHLSGGHFRDVHPRSLEDITEQSLPPTPELSSDCETMPECPRINMTLTSSPFFNEYNPTFCPIPKPTPGTPGAASLAQNICGYPFQMDTLSVLSGPETPASSVNTCRSHYPTTPHSNFLMSTGSPGMFNLTLKTPTKRQLSLLSPHHIPSPLGPRDAASYSKNPRGPGPDMLATLEFLSDLCQKTPQYMDDQNSLSDYASLENSPIF